MPDSQPTDAARKVADMMVLGIRDTAEDLAAGRFSLEALRDSSLLVPPLRLCAAVVVLNLYGDPREAEARKLLGERLSGPGRSLQPYAADHWKITEHYIQEMRRTMGIEESA